MVFKMESTLPSKSFSKKSDAGLSFGLKVLPSLAANRCWFVRCVECFTSTSPTVCHLMQLMTNLWRRQVDYPWCAGGGHGSADPPCSWRKWPLGLIKWESHRQSVLSTWMGETVSGLGPAANTARWGGHPRLHVCETRALKYHGHLPTC